AARLLAKVRVRRAVARGKARLRRRFGDAQERAVRELLRLAFSDIGDVVDLTDRDHPRLKPHADIPPDARRAVQEIGRTRHGVRVRMADKLAALDKVFRHLGLFRDLPPLEVLLGALPPAVAEAVRAALAAQVHGGGDPAGGTGTWPGWRSGSRRTRRPRCGRWGGSRTRGRRRSWRTATRGGRCSAAAGRARARRARRGP